MALVFAGLSPTRLSGQMPQARLWSVVPSGAQKGKETSIRLSGADLDGIESVLFSHPGIKAEAKLQGPSPYEEFLGEKPRLDAGHFVVKIGEEVPPGRYEVRAVGAFGVTNPRCFVVGSGEEVSEQEGNNSLGEAREVPFGCTVNGVIGGANDKDFFRFQAAGGKRIVVECLAARIDSRLLPVLVAYNSGGIEIGRSRIDKRRDALLDLKAPEDGVLTIEVRDLRYKGSGDFFYRLSISARPHVDTIFPPVAVPGSEQEFMILGKNLPGGQPAPEYSFNGTVPEKIVRKIRVPEFSGSGGAIVESRDFGVQRFPEALQKDLGSSDGSYLWVASNQVFTETEPNNSSGKATRINIPCEAAGRFYPRGDRDWFEFEAVEDGVLKVEVRSQRLGLGTDPVFVVQEVSVGKDGKESLKELKFQDDGLPNIGGGHFGTVSDDPFGEFPAKKGGRYRILVRDLYSDARADPRNVYSLVVRKPEPDFGVVLLPGYPESDPDPKKNKPGVWGSLLRRNGTDRFIAYAHRKDGFAGEIELEFEGLPESIKGGKGRIAAGKNSTTVLLHVGADVVDWKGPLRVFAKSRLGEKEVRREVTYGTLLWSGISSARLTSGLGLAVRADEKSPFRLEPASAVYEMAQGGSIDLALKIHREDWAQGKITVNVLGLPPNVELKKFDVGDKKTEVKVKVNIKPGAPAGAQSFYLRGNTEVQYKRGSAAAARAKKRHEKMGEILKTVTGEAAAKNKTFEESKKAQAKSQEDTKKLAGTAAAAKKASATSAEDLKAAQEKLQAAADAVKNNPTDQGLVTAKGEAEKAVKSVGEKNKELAGKSGEAEKKHLESMEVVRTADEARKKAEEEAKVSREKEGRAKKALDSSKKEADGLANAAKPKKMKVGVYSVPININVTVAAFAFDGELAPPEGFKVKAGQTGELPVKIKRLYGFNEQVKVKAILKGAKGVKIAEIQVPKDKSDSMLKIEADQKAPVGKYDIEIQAAAKFGSANQVLKSNFQLVIEAPEKPETKKDEPEKKKDEPKQ